VSQQSSVAKELRQFVADIEKLAVGCPCYSVVLKPVQVLCDHISAVARINELNAEREK
jgi:hypothetical protein